MARPEGQRCLVIASHQSTISRQRNGSILHKFPSCLPNGSRSSTSGSGDDVCVLDCIFHEAGSSYYVIDMMCWKGYALYDCSAEFRLFWVQTKLLECMMEASPDQHRYPFVPIAAHTCTQGDATQAAPLQNSPDAKRVIQLLMSPQSLFPICRRIPAGIFRLSTFPT